MTKQGLDILAVQAETQRNSPYEFGLTSEPQVRVQDGGAVITLRAQSIDVQSVEEPVPPSLSLTGIRPEDPLGE